jgi:hypothetical protein
MSYPITHYRGDTFPGRAVNISLSGSPIDLTGASIKMQIKSKDSDVEAKLEASTDNGLIVITDAANGSFKFLEDTIIDLVPKEYRYDVQITLSNGKVLTPIKNTTFTIEGDVTRD